MAVRCIRCGATVDGYSQVCDSCAAEKRAAEAAHYERAVQATTLTCPGCSQAIPRASEACPNCSRSFVETGLTFISLVRADFFVRLVAYLIDYFAFAFVGGVFAVIIGDPLTAAAILGVAQIIVTTGFWLTLGATPGKLLMGIKIVSVEGDRIGIGHCLLRFLGYLACAFTLGYGYLLIAIGHEKRGLEDIISGTIVVYRDTIPARKPKTEPASAA
jgi:uncharacterized RDD family membrane protein YckC